MTLPTCAAGTETNKEFLLAKVATRRVATISRVYLIVALFVTITVLLAGCTSLAPPHERPALPVAGRYPDEIAGGIAAPTLGWNDFFADPHLRRLISLALEHNRDLRTAVLQVQEARALHGIQRAERLPSVGLGVASLASPQPAAVTRSVWASTPGSWISGAACATFRTPRCRTTSPPTKHATPCN